MATITSPAQDNSPTSNEMHRGVAWKPEKPDEVIRMNASTQTTEDAEGTSSPPPPPTPHQEIVTKTEEQSRLISTLQIEKEHLQSQCSEFETAGIQAAIHSREMKTMIHNLQGAMQAMKERNNVLSNQLQQTSSYMNQIMPSYNWYINRVKFLEMNHCNVMQRYVELQSFCKSLVQEQCVPGSNNSAIPGSGIDTNEQSTRISFPTFTQNGHSQATMKQSFKDQVGSSSEENHQEQHVDGKRTASNTVADCTHPNVVPRKHRPFLQPKSAAFVGVDEKEESRSFSHDLLLEGGKTVEDVLPPSSTDRGGKKKASLRGSPRPTLQSRRPEESNVGSSTERNEIKEEDIQQDSAILCHTSVSNILPNKKQQKSSFAQQAYPGKMLSKSCRTQQAIDTTPIFQITSKRTTFTDNNKQTMAEKRLITPSPPIRTQTQAAGQNQINMNDAMMQYAHHCNYMTHHYQNLMHHTNGVVGGPYFQHAQNHHMSWMMGSQAAACHHQYNTRLLQPGTSDGASPNPSHLTNGHKKSIDRKKKAGKKTGPKSSGCSGSISSTTNTSKQTKRRKVSISL